MNIESIDKMIRMAMGFFVNENLMPVLYGFIIEDRPSITGIFPPILNSSILITSLKL